MMTEVTGLFLALGLSLVVFGIMNVVTTAAGVWFRREKLAAPAKLASLGAAGNTTGSMMSKELSSHADILYLEDLVPGQNYRPDGTGEVVGTPRRSRISRAVLIRSRFISTKRRGALLDVRRTRGQRMAYRRANHELVGEWRTAPGRRHHRRGSR